MNQTSLLLLPVFIQVGLTLLLLFRLGPARIAAIRSGEVKIKDIALGQRAWPPHITQISNTYASQFELPVLFYAGVLLALVTRKVDVWLVAGAWIFALSRLAHAYVYVGSNNIPARFRAFTVGVFALLAMWIWLAGRILIEGI